MLELADRQLLESRKNRPTVSFYTFGCRLNQAETAILEQSFRKAGYAVVDIRQPADVVVVNTCTVTEHGDADTRKLCNRIRRLNPHARIALVGCQAQVQRDKLLNLPNVHWVVGNARKLELRQILESTPPSAGPSVIAPVIRKQSFTVPFVGVDRYHTRANLKIQDGCDFFCSFCEIPYARGRARSRRFSDLLAEAVALARAGHHELVLTGINIGTYRDGQKSLVDVLDALEQVEGLWRIRISSIEPTTIPDAVLDKMAQGGNVCRHLHVPLQSGSNVILKAMNRLYTVEEYTDFVQQAWNRIEGLCLGTDVIVGFPGESDAAFQETYHLLRDLPLAYFHVFSYSERQHARSRRLEQKVPPGVVKQRSRLLRELSHRKRQQFMHRFVGKVLPVLFEQEKNGVWVGLTDNYLRVRVSADFNLRNQLLPVRLQAVDGSTLVGELA